MSNISFSLIPKNIRVPGAYAEFDNRNAVTGLSNQPYRVLLIGQMLTGGTQTPLVPVDITRAEEAALLFGQGSMLTGMVEAYKKNDQFTKLTVVALNDDSSGSKAEGTITITGTATQSGVLNLYVGGKRVRVGVDAGDDSATISASIIAAVTVDQNCLVMATTTSNGVTLTAKHSGETGNEIDVVFNYYSDETTPSGIITNVAVPALSGGTGNPDLVSVIAAMGDSWYNIIVSPYTDAANLVLLENEMADRFGPMRAIDGVVFLAKNANHAGLITLCRSRNSPHLSICESYNYPLPPYERAAMIAAQVAVSAQNDPARPFQTLTLFGDMAPQETDRMTMTERNLLLFEGCSTSFIDAGGQVHIERLISTYTENSLGAPDISYLDINTLLTLSYLRYSWRIRVLLRFPRMKLGDDGARGDNVMTPKTMKAEMIALAGEWADLGLIENLEEFKKSLIVVRPATDVNRLDIILPPDLMNQLRIMATRIDFRL